MARFCTKCGRPLSDGERCTCQEQQKSVSNRKSLWVKLLTHMGVGAPSVHSANMFEKNQRIVPDVVQPNENEIPIKEYDVAFLKSRIRGQYARGRLQVTNKRVLFRAAGMSYSGPVAQQYEFAVDEVAGIELRKSNRISILNVFLCFLLNFMITTAVAGVFNSFAAKAPIFASICSVLFALSCIVPFFVIRRKFWLKLLIICCGLGALWGTGSVIDMSVSNLLYGLETNISDYLYLALYPIWLLNVVLVSLVPDLIITIKTKGASEAINIRRKLFATPFRQAVEYTGFSEVTPGRDFDTAAHELGSLIGDINTLGDLAVEKWKEKE